MMYLSRWKKLLLPIVTLVIFFSISSGVFAANGSRTGDLDVEDRTVIPYTDKDITSCQDFMNDKLINKDETKAILASRNNEKEIRDILGCAISTGEITLWMVPYYVRFILELLLQLSGLIAIGAIIYGAYLYVFSYVIEDKDEGKRAIIYGLVGLVVSLLAWVFVNLFISALT